jgi:hypothetical protein
MGVLTALALAGALCGAEPEYDSRYRPVPHERSWGEILAGFSIGASAGGSWELPLGGDAPPGARFGLHADFRLARWGPVEFSLILPIAGRNRQDGDSTLGGFELMPAVGFTVRPLPFLRISLEGAGGMLLQSLHDDDGTHDKTGIAARAALPIEFRLTPLVWLGVSASVLRDFTAKQGYGELTAGATVRY